MNGRIFDPTLGRFMQPDPYVQDPLNLQNFERYAYCYNNPTTCTDPSGYFSLRHLLGAITGISLARHIAHTQIGYQIGSIAIAVLSTYCGAVGMQALCNGVGQAAWSAMAGHGATASIRAGVFAAVSVVVNGAIHVGTDGNIPMNVAAHTAWGCAEGAMQGGSCRAGAISGSMSAAWANTDAVRIGNPQKNLGDLVYNTMTNAVVGGITSVAAGGDFANGARSGAFGYLYNAMAGRLIGQQVGAWGSGALCVEMGPGAAVCAMLGRMAGGWAGSAIEDWAFSADNASQAGAESGSEIAPRPDYPPQSGGRSGENVKDASGPPNSAIPSTGGSVWITDGQGNVVVDVTPERAKPVTPGVGFGEKRPPTKNELDLWDKVKGGK
jgi:hypothetical protein